MRKNKKRGFHTKNNKLILESPQSKIVFSLIVLALAVLIVASVTEIVNYNQVRLSPNVKGIEYDGYIIEFKEKPLAVINKELDSSVVASTDKKQRLNEQKNKIAIQRENFKGKLKTISPKAKVRREFDSVFNGISISKDITKKQINELKKDPNVKRISPNYKLELFLNESVPLINADDVWKLDAQGNNCTQSGQECLTGKNVTIGIIDTGVDYTHPDFGACSSLDLFVFEQEKIPYSKNSNNLYDNNGSIYHYSTYFHYYTWYINYPEAEKLSLHFNGIIINNSIIDKLAYFLIHNDSINDSIQYSGFPPSYKKIYQNKSDWWVGTFSGGLVKVSSIIESSTPETPSFEEFGTFKVDYLGLGNFSMNWSKCEKIDKGYNFVFNNADPMDYYFHGTAVASVAAGRGDWNKDGVIEENEGFSGVAPDAKITPYVINGFNRDAFMSELIQAIELSADPNRDSDFSDHIEIVSLSAGLMCEYLGGYNDECGPDDILSQTVDNAVNLGSVFVIAAGNSGESGIASPGVARKAITVGGANKEDQVVDYSSRGPVIWVNTEGITQTLIKPDVVAPTEICSAKPLIFPDRNYDDYPDCHDNKHFIFSGTSAAAPHVSGAVALIKQAHTQWTPEQVKEALKNTAIDLGYDENTQGAGRIDVLEAVKYHFCGNSLIEAGEQCDDGNLNNPDGCSSTCQIQSYFECSGQPSICKAICTDSDGGDKPYRKGIVNIEAYRINVQDSCFNSTMVREYICDWDAIRNETIANSKVQSCNTWCTDGYCTYSPQGGPIPTKVPRNPASNIQ